MATSTGQRVGIWIIAIAMTLGTIVGFVTMIISSDNQGSQQAVLQKYQAAYTAYQSTVSAQQTELDGRADKLSNRYYDDFAPMKKNVAKFDAGSVTKLSTKTYLQGKGETIGDSTTYVAYYIGWTPDGKIFDSSLGNKKLKTPLIVRPGGVIPGWSEGMKGKKMGGVYRLKIPSEQAYGSKGSGDTIPPNSPLTFIVMPIETLKTITEPAVPQELLQ